MEGWCMKNCNKIEDSFYDNNNFKKLMRFLDSHINELV